MITPEESKTKKQENRDHESQVKEDQNTNIEHMRIDEEGNEVGPDDEI